MAKRYPNKAARNGDFAFVSFYSLQAAHVSLVDDDSAEGTIRLLV